MLTAHQILPGWYQHGSLLCVAILATMAVNLSSSNTLIYRNTAEKVFQWATDLILLNKLRHNMPSTTIHFGYVIISLLPLSKSSCLQYL